MITIPIAHVLLRNFRSLRAVSCYRMAAAGSMSYGANGFARGASSLQHTVTALNRWSVANKQLPRK